MKERQLIITLRQEEYLQNIYKHVNTEVSKLINTRYFNDTIEDRTKRTKSESITSISRYKQK